MYTCKCGSEFCTPSYRLGNYGYEIFCPDCGSNEYEQLEECEICGIYTAKEELHDGICEFCIAEIEEEEENDIVRDRSCNSRLY